MCQTVILLTATLALLSGQAFAQTNPTRQDCSAAVGIDWNNSTLLGNWLELARNPGANTNACLEFRTGVLTNGSLSINATHSSSSTSTYQNIDEPQVIVNFTTGNTAGYNISLTAGKFVKINLLEVVNNGTYLLGCGYTNDNSTSFGFILGRGNLYNATGLKLANDEASLKYNNFVNSSYSTILQQGCTRNSASQSLPLISGFVALALLLIKAH